MPSLVNAALPPSVENVDLSLTDYVPPGAAVLQVGAAGNIKVDLASGFSSDLGVTIAAQVGYLLCPVSKVYKTGTDAGPAAAMLAYFTRPNPAS